MPEVFVSGNPVFLDDQFLRNVRPEMCDRAANLDVRRARAETSNHTYSLTIMGVDKNRSQETKGRNPHALRNKYDAYSRLPLMKGMKAMTGDEEEIRERDTFHLCVGDTIPDLT